MGTACSLKDRRTMMSMWKLRPPQGMLTAMCVPYPARFLRDLDARAKNECYRATFRLPKDERLDGHTSCTLWTPFNKLHNPGQMFISNNYICFASKEEDACHLIIPLREVRPAAAAQASAQSLQDQAGLGPDPGP